MKRALGCAPRHAERLRDLVDVVAVSDPAEQLQSARVQQALSLHAHPARFVAPGDVFRSVRDEQGLASRESRVPPPRPVQVPQAVDRAPLRHRDEVCLHVQHIARVCLADLKQRLARALLGVVKRPEDTAGRSDHRVPVVCQTFCLDTHASPPASGRDVTPAVAVILPDSRECCRMSERLPVSGATGRRTTEDHHRHDSILVRLLHPLNGGCWGSSGHRLGDVAGRRSDPRHGLRRRGSSWRAASARRMRDQAGLRPTPCRAAVSRD